MLIDEAVYARVLRVKVNIVRRLLLLNGRDGCDVEWVDHRLLAHITSGRASRLLHVQHLYAVEE